MIVPRGLSIFLVGGVLRYFGIFSTKLVQLNAIRSSEHELDRCQGQANRDRDQQQQNDMGRDYRQSCDDYLVLL